MAVRASREIVIDAPPEAILDAIADIEAAPTWSSVHKHVHVVDRYPDGRPRRVKVTVKVLGIIDHEMVEYHWGRDWVVWDADRTAQQHAQHGEYTLRPEGARPESGSISPWNRLRRCRISWSSARRRRC
ncbi:SRPBCC family protein [Mycolicibacterium psychrotolerans]|uniref:SRPBCC family protein n=1 Tax=Mycolicibacterium psychrotolerans TaxID=216929 RepID=UPI003D67931C